MAVVIKCDNISCPLYDDGYCKAEEIEIASDGLTHRCISEPSPY